MKKYWIILLLAVALVAVSGRLAYEINSHSAPAPDATTGATFSSAGSSDVLDCIMTRHSVRAYSDKAVPDSLVQKILKAGMAAPTACNQQAWELVVVTDTTLLASISSLADPWSMVKDAQLAVIVCGNKELFFKGEEVGGRYWDQDCSAVTENMLLAAHSLGIGAVWCGVYPMPDRMDALRDALRLPARLIPLNVVAMGYPQSPGQPKDKWDPGKVHYNAY